MMNSKNKKVMSYKKGGMVFRACQSCRSV